MNETPETTETSLPPVTLELSMKLKLPALSLQTGIENLLVWIAPVVARGATAVLLTQQSGGEAREIVCVAGERRGMEFACMIEQEQPDA